MVRFLLAPLALLSTASLSVAGPILPLFSVDPASPAVSGALTPDDTVSPGPAVATDGVSFDLRESVLTGDFDNLNALSFGRDPLRRRLVFSVDRVAVGRPGTAVIVEAAPGAEEAAGDLFLSDSTGGNTRYRTETSLGLLPGFFGDDVDGVELDTLPAPYTYFSIDGPSSTNGFGALDLANDILISTGAGTFSTFADGINHIGLMPSDDLDALTLWDAVNPGTLDPGSDFALFSLSAFSPSAFTFGGTSYCPGVSGFLSPADILFTDFASVFQFDCGGQLVLQKFGLWASAAAMGLRADDNVDALDTVPEPVSGLLWTIGLAACAGHRWCARRWRRLARDSRGGPPLAHQPKGPEGRSIEN